MAFFQPCCRLFPKKAFLILPFHKFQCHSKLINKKKTRNRQEPSTKYIVIKITLFILCNGISTNCHWKTTLSPALKSKTRLNLKFVRFQFKQRKCVDNYPLLTMDYLMGWERTNNNNNNHNIIVIIIIIKLM